MQGWYHRNHNMFPLGECSTVILGSPSCPPSTDNVGRHMRPSAVCLGTCMHWGFGGGKVSTSVKGQHMQHLFCVKKHKVILEMLFISLSSFLLGFPSSMGNHGFNPPLPERLAPRFFPWLICYQLVDWQSATLNVLSEASVMHELLERFSCRNKNLETRILGAQDSVA